MSLPKDRVSIVTTVFNSATTLECCLKSVHSQTFENLEHIAIDGGSTDGSLEILNRWRPQLAYFESGLDEGIYDGLNRGIQRASGSIIGILHSDDFYARPTAISEVVSQFENPKVDAVFSDVNYVSSEDPHKIIRDYSSAKWTPNRLAWGWIPAHPTLFLRREVYERVGLFDISYKIAGDFEFISRAFWQTGIQFSYLPGVLISMRAGGTSNASWKHRWQCNREIQRACAKNKIPTNLLKLSFRYAYKLAEFTSG